MLNNDQNDENNTQDKDKEIGNQNLELLPFKKNVSFKWEKLEFNEKFQTNDLTFNLWDNNFNLQKNIHIEDNLDIRYQHGKDCIYFKLKIENINGTIERGHVERIQYFRPTSLIQTGLIYDIFSVIEDKICEKLDIKFIDIIDRAGLIPIACLQKLPLNKVVYFRDLIVIFDRIEKVTYRGKSKYCIVTNIISGDVLLQK